MSLTSPSSDPGTGPALHYSLVGEERLELSCAADLVFPLPSLHLSWDPALAATNKTQSDSARGLRNNTSQTFCFRPEAGDLMRTTVRRGSVFSVSVTTSLPVSLLPPSISLSCRLTLPGDSDQQQGCRVFQPGPLRIAGTDVVLTETSVFFIEQLQPGPKARKAQM